MQLQQAISLRIQELVKENGMTLNQLAERSGLSASSITRTVKADSSVGVGIPFKEFWHSPLFEDIEAEIED